MVNERREPLLSTMAMAYGETAKVQPEDLQKSLEWAGMILLSMNIKSPFPGLPQSAWPSYASEAATAYGYSGERIRPAQPTGRDIALMDKVLLLPNLVTDLNSRRLLHARALVTPVGNRHLYSWSKLAFMLHSDRRKIVRTHYNALLEVVGKLENDKIDVIWQSLSR